MRSAAHSYQHEAKDDSGGVAADCLTGLRRVRVGDRTSRWSDAAAVTLMPAMAMTAGHVTMLQRSPSYVMALPHGRRGLSARLPRARWAARPREFTASPAFANELGYF